MVYNTNKHVFLLRVFSTCTKKGFFMKINNTLAQSIVESLRNTIKQDINFIDNNGVIIASTDKKRINTIHKGALICLEKKETIAITSDDQYPGSKKGVNLPVNFQDEIIGVIGISGDLDIVEKYGNIIKKMTEILLREEWIKETQSAKLENSKLIIESILNSQLYHLDLVPKSLENSYKHFSVAEIPLDELGFDIKRNLVRYSESNYEKDKIYSTIIHDKFINIYIDSNEEKITNHLLKLYATCKNNHNLSLDFGISDKFINIEEAKNFYNQALKAYDWAKVSKAYPIFFYKKMHMGLLITSLNEKDLLEYSKRILKSIDPNDIKFYQDLFFLYGKHNGSISKISKDMYMHKNSIQYRLNKLKELTGYDSRNFNDYVILWFAFFAIKKIAR